MHEVIELKNVIKPKGEVYIVYFSSISNNTHRFVEKLNILNSRIPIKLSENLNVDKDFVLITPTYAAGGSDSKGAVPKQVIQFLNIESNRKHCKGVISSGNTNFGDTFAIAGPIISNKLQIPFLYQFELLGTQFDVENVKNILNNFFDKE